MTTTEKILTAKEILDRSTVKGNHFYCYEHGIVDCSECAEKILKESK